MGLLNNMVGRIFGKLTVIARDVDKLQNTYWICKCSCESGKTKSVRGSHLKAGRIQSCGCLYNKIRGQKLPNNQFIFRDNYKIGITYDGKEFYYDVEDAYFIEEHTWYFDKDGYVITRINNKGVKMHKLIIPSSRNEIIDHKNQNKFDNRKDNLRKCDSSQSAMNIRRRNHNTSGVTGVGWHKTSNKWRVRINYNKKSVFLGEFENFEDAVKVRKEAEQKYFGEFAPK